MTRYAIALCVGLVSAIIFSPSASFAQNEASVSIQLRAVVQPFCRIQSELGDEPTYLIDGSADLGLVKEVCNTPGGYNLDVQMINVSSGTIQTGESTQALDPNGRAHIFWGQARSRTASWRLAQAALQQDDMPIYLRVSISPV